MPMNIAAIDAIGSVSAPTRAICAMMLGRLRATSRVHETMATRSLTLSPMTPQSAVTCRPVFSIIWSMVYGRLGSTFRPGRLRVAKPNPRQVE